MGLVYSYDIYVRPWNVARVLANLADLAPRARAVPPLEITLPGGDRLVLPFTSHFKSEPVDCSTSSTLELDTSLMFDVDDALREYAQMSGREPEADGRIQIAHPGDGLRSPLSRSASTCGGLVRLREVSIGAPSRRPQDRVTSS